MSCPTFYEHMFPRLRQKLCTALVDRIDLVVEFSTLGEYALADDLLPVATHDDHPAAGAAFALSAPTLSTERSRLRDDCPLRERPLSRRPSD